MVKMKKSAVKSIMIFAVAVLVVLAVVITNIFIPVKYLSAYVIFSRNKNGDGNLRVTFLNVGYGDCTLVEFPQGECALIDSGGGEYSQTLEVLRLLNSRGIDNINYLICSSVSSNACGGFTEILKYKSVEKIYAPFALTCDVNESLTAFISAVKKCGADTNIIEYGEGESFSSGAYFYFLSPSVHTLNDGEYAAANADCTEENLANVSAVIWIKYLGISFLLLGDTYSAAAQNLYNNYKLDENYFSFSGKTIKLESCNIVKVASHGSANSAYAPLYDLLKPEAAIISVGSNTDNCPSADIISDIYPYAGRNIFRTDENGAITVTVSGGEYVIDKEK